RYAPTSTSDYFNSPAASSACDDSELHSETISKGQVRRDADGLVDQSCSWALADEELLDERADGGGGQSCADSCGFQLYPLELR
ncbi:hypothetical protein ACH4A7_38070, partial [Streptomyces cyaneofuscatus]|uniref:hypothetical protein n=1 Tax=Streptomyces cyaneofuscatus TaxID=66883 RepID=UPI0037B74604